MESSLIGHYGQNVMSHAVGEPEKETGLVLVHSMEVKTAVFLLQQLSLATHMNAQV